MIECFAAIFDTILTLKIVEMYVLESFLSVT